MKTNFKQFLIERLVATDTKQVQTRSGQPVSRVFNNADKDSSAGSFSYVKPDKNDPHVVHKYQKSHAVNDPYWDFIRHMYEEDMIDNPYLPKIYRHTVVKDQKNNTKNSATIETLQPMSTASNADKFHIFHRVFGEEFETSIWGENYLKNKRFNGDRYNEDHAATFAMNLLFGTLERIVDGKDDISLIDDPDLIDALKFIRKIKRNYNAMSDLHQANFMLRRGPTGAQLVIIDPLWIGGQTPDPE